MFKIFMERVASNHVWLSTWLPCELKYILLGEKHGQTVVIRVNRLANIRIRIAKYGHHLYFNQRCKENYELPSSLRFRPPLRSAKGYKLMVRTGFSFLRLRIDECQSSILCLRALFSRPLSELSALINNSETSWVEEFCSSKEQQTFTKQREKHDIKLHRLLSKRSPVNSGLSLIDKWVINFSSKELPERSGLEKAGSEVCYCSSQNHDCRNCRRCRGEHLSSQRRP